MPSVACQASITGGGRTEPFSRRQQAVNTVAILPICLPFLFFLRCFSLSMFVLEASFDNMAAQMFSQNLKRKRCEPEMQPAALALRKSELMGGFMTLICLGMSRMRVRSSAGASMMRKVPPNIPDLPSSEIMVYGKCSYFSPPLLSTCLSLGPLCIEFVLRWFDCFVLIGAEHVSKFAPKELSVRDFFHSGGLMALTGGFLTVTLGSSDLKKRGKAGNMGAKGRRGTTTLRGLKRPSFCDLT